MTDGPLCNNKGQKVSQKTPQAKGSTTYLRQTKEEKPSLKSKRVKKSSENLSATRFCHPQNKAVHPISRETDKQKPEWDREVCVTPGRSLPITGPSEYFPKAGNESQEDVASWVIPSVEDGEVPRTPGRGTTEASETMAKRVQTEGGLGQDSHGHGHPHLVRRADERGGVLKNHAHKLTGAITPTRRLSDSTTPHSSPSSACVAGDESLTPPDLDLTVPESTPTTPRPEKITSAQKIIIPANQLLQGVIAAAQTTRWPGQRRKFLYQGAEGAYRIIIARSGAVTIQKLGGAETLP